MGGPYCLQLRGAGELARGQRRQARRVFAIAIVAALALALTPTAAQAAPNRPPEPKPEALDYLISPGDVLQVFVWKNPELSTEVPVRPDGRITTPLVPDVQAQGRTPTDLAADLQRALSEFVRDPVVTVSVKSFAAAENDSAIRVIGAVVEPQGVPYRPGLTALDVMIETGGLAPEANGNGAKLIRLEKDGYKTYPLRLKNLIRRGDAAANVRLMPGDIIQIPESFF